MRGLINSEFAERHDAEFPRELGAGIANGRSYREDIVQGLDKAPEAFIGMLDGRNFGKLIDTSEHYLERAVLMRSAVRSSSSTQTPDTPSCCRNAVPLANYHAQACLSAPAFYRLLAIVLKVSLRLVPIVAMKETAATEIKAPIRLYSIAVTPRSSPIRRETRLSIYKLYLISVITGCSLGTFY